VEVSIEADHHKRTSMLCSNSVAWQVYESTRVQSKVRCYINHWLVDEPLSLLLTIIITMQPHLTTNHNNKAKHQIIS